MANQDVRARFLLTFNKEWKLHLAQEKNPSSAQGLEAKKSAAFDSPVNAGEVRLLADGEQLVIGLVLGKGGRNHWTLVPVSPFSVPATEQEILVGSRTYQLWNVRTLPAKTASRSWLVEKLSENDVKDVQGALRCVLTGEKMPEDLIACTGLPISSSDDPRLDYERSYRLALGERTADVRAISEKMRKNRGSHFGRDLLAASILLTLVCGAVFYFGNAQKNRISVAGDAAAGLTGNAASLAECARKKDCTGVNDIHMSAKRFRSTTKMELDSRCEAPCMTANAVAPSVACDDTAIGSERYADFRENEFLDVSRVPLSTFGLDVDTASYVAMRRYLTQENRRPPSSSVRLEEYVNYFNYDYPEPKGDCPIAVHCELGACPWAKNHKLLRVGLQARRINKDKMPPANLVFLLDCSGSMSFNGGFDTLIKSMKMLTDQLRNEDHVSIVTYANGTRVALEATSGRDKAKIHSVLDSLYASGGTCGQGGIQLAYAQAERHFDKNANNRIILMTDGDFNIGMSDPRDLGRYIADKRQTGVFLTVLGVGRGNYQDATMKKLATAGNGNYASIDGLLEAKKVMMTELTGTLNTIAKDVKLQLEFNPAQTASYRLLGYETRRLEDKDFNDDKKDAGEMGAGHTMTALYELVPVGVKSDVSTTDPLKYQKSVNVPNDELLTVKLRYKEPKGDVSKLVETPVKASAIDRKGDNSVDFVFASAVAEYALVLGKSKFAGSASIKQAIERARESKGADKNGYRAEFIRLAEMAELMPEQPAPVRRFGRPRLDEMDK